LCMCSPPLLTYLTFPLLCNTLYHLILPIDCRHDHKYDMSIARHDQYGSGSRTLPRPPVCAVSFKPPTTGPQSHRRKSESVTVPRPPVCAVSFKPPTTGPQSRHRKSESVTVPRPPVCAVSLKPPTTGPQSRHRKSESESVTVPRPPVCAVSSKPPTTGPQFRHRNSDSESMTFPRPPVCAVSFKPPTIGPHSRRPRRCSFDHATGNNHSGEQHPVNGLPPTGAFHSLVHGLFLIWLQLHRCICVHCDASPRWRRFVAFPSAAAKSLRSKSPSREAKPLQSLQQAALGNNVYFTKDPLQICWQSMILFLCPIDLDS
jgi:hypothetical protein